MGGAAALMYAGLWRERERERQREGESESRLYPHARLQLGRSCWGHARRDGTWFVCGLCGVGAVFCLHYVVCRMERSGLSSNPRSRQPAISCRSSREPVCLEVSCSCTWTHSLLPSASLRGHVHVQI